MNTDDTVAMLRHTLATVAYRGRKAVSGAPRDFSGFRANPGTRTPGQILAHICDLFDWGLSLAAGKHVWHDSAPEEWERDVARFHASLAAFDRRLASGTPLGCPAESLFQGPVADALAHIGQIAMLRRMAGGPVKGENYFKAEIQTGRVGTEQAAPRVEFD
jgi:hypothetical protein